MDIRPSPIAGAWYPRNAERLRSDLARSFGAVPDMALDGALRGVLAPHAGHRYSGGVAAHAFKRVIGLAAEIVVLIGPYHRAHRGRVLTSDHAAYETPLGLAPVDRPTVDEFRNRLREDSGIEVTGIRHDPEHSLEIELPFLQHALSGFRILPIMLVDQSREVAEAVGRVLAEILGGRKSLLVASSDLSHFFPDDVARRLDGEMLRRVEAFDPAGVLQAEDEEAGFACGRGAIAAALWAARGLGADRVRILNHATSGDITGDRSSVVGYGAAAITGHER